MGRMKLRRKQRSSIGKTSSNPYSSDQWDQSIGVSGSLGNKSNGSPSIDRMSNLSESAGKRTKSKGKKKAAAPKSSGLNKNNAANRSRKFSPN